MRLADFILANIEPILVEWESFARAIWPGVVPDAATLRDDAESMLRATAAEMATAQTELQRSDKSKGAATSSREGVRLDGASTAHGQGRSLSKFDLPAVIAEYRALRASVLRLWRVSNPHPDLHDLDDVTRFNESIDQSLAEAVRSYTEQVTREREAILAKEKESRAEAEAANRSKDLFLATLSHELRTPLGAIVGWLEILRKHKSDNAILTEGLDVIERNTNAQVHLINDVLDVSGIITGKLSVELRECDLWDVVNAGTTAIRPAAAARNITLSIQCDDNTKFDAMCDAARIQQVVWNLVSNSVKFTPPGGQVQVTLSREESGFKITVTDTGQGITPELLPFIFDRFRQGDSSTKRKLGGLGLGLSVVKYLVEAHGGTVEAHSAGEGRGATFVVRLLGA